MTTLTSRNPFPENREISSNSDRELPSPENRNRTSVFVKTGTPNNKPKHNFNMESEMGRLFSKLFRLVSIW